MGQSRERIEARARHESAAYVDKRDVRNESNFERRRVTHGGLCKTCRNSVTCTYPRNADSPVVSCEEFELCLRPDDSPTACAASSQFTENTLIGDVNDQENEFHGLCVSCRRLPSCTFEKPESGVWRCEEFE